jgi:hypothetical protein
LVCTVFRLSAGASRCAFVHLQVPLGNIHTVAHRARHR